jgi:hypothetical protein
VNAMGRNRSCRGTIPARRNTEITQTFMPRVGFEPTTPVSEKAKTCYVLHLAAYVIDPCIFMAKNLI